MSLSLQCKKGIRNQKNKSTSPMLYIGCKIDVLSMNILVDQSDNLTSCEEHPLLVMLNFSLYRFMVLCAFCTV